MEKKSVIKKITGSREALLAIIVIVLFAVVTAISPSFLTPKSLMEMLKNNAVTMVMSLGMLCVMLVGGIDISIMSTLALSGMSIGNRYCLRTCCRSCDLKSKRSADHCNHGLYVHLQSNGISCFSRW